jgi:hypothetical protein
MPLEQTVFEFAVTIFFAQASLEDQYAIFRERLRQITAFFSRIVCLNETTVAEVFQ